MNGIAAEAMLVARHKVSTDTLENCSFQEASALAAIKTAA